MTVVREQNCLYKLGKLVNLRNNVLSDDMGQDFESKVRYSLVGICYNWELLSCGDITHWNEQGHLAHSGLSPTSRRQLCDVRENV